MEKLYREAILESCQAGEVTTEVYIVSSGRLDAVVTEEAPWPLTFCILLHLCFPFLWHLLSRSFVLSLRSPFPLSCPFPFQVLSLLCLSFSLPFRSRRKTRGKGEAKAQAEEKERGQAREEGNSTKGKRKS